MHRQTIANPRRTTLAHVKDASELVQAAVPAAVDEATAAAAEVRVLPTRTANPRRTVLTELPGTPVAP